MISLVQRVDFRLRESVPRCARGRAHEWWHYSTSTLEKETQLEMYIAELSVAAADAERAAPLETSRDLDTWDPV